MRDFRDAKAMARSLRDALNAKAIETTHTEALELIAKAFGYENWNILSAKIETAEPSASATSSESATPPASDERSRSIAARNEPAQPKTLYCSFCGKSQHEVRTLVAGPSSLFICDECVELCIDVIEPENALELFRLMRANEESGVAVDPAVLELARRASTEELAHYVELGRKGVERNRAALQAIERRPATHDGNVDHNQGSIGGRAAMRQKAQRELKRYEDVLSMATTVLNERRQ